MITLEQLPPKGIKRENAILELGKDEANGELLYQLVEIEKGKCKTAAQKALAQLEYAPAAPLWAKLVKGKWMGSHIMSDACSDCVYRNRSHRSSRKQSPSYWMREIQSRWKSDN